MIDDWAQFRSMAKQKSLAISCQYGKEAVGYDEILKRSPTRAHISWKRADNGESVWSVDLSKNELEECISKLKEEAIKVPVEIDLALINFPID